jgi:hypothetical protein
MTDLVEKRRQAVAMNEAAARMWADAMRVHITAPPDPGFADRLRALGEAARTRARAARVAHAAGLKWVSQPGAMRAQPPPELRPGSGRVGPPELWERFDVAVAGYNAAIAHTDAGAVADAADAVAEIVEELAAAVDAERGQVPAEPARGRSKRTR